MFILFFIMAILTWLATAALSLSTIFLVIVMVVSSILNEDILREGVLHNAVEVWLMIIIFWGIMVTSTGLISKSLYNKT